MKRKRVTFSEESIQTTLNSVKKKPELINSERLRRKLKNLIEKSQGDLYLLVPTKKTSSCSSIPSQDTSINIKPNKKTVMITGIANDGKASSSKPYIDLAENGMQLEPLNMSVKIKSKEKRLPSKKAKTEKTEKISPKTPRPQNTLQPKLSNLSVKVTKKEPNKPEATAKAKEIEKILKNPNAVKIGKLNKMLAKSKQTVESVTKLIRKTNVRKCKSTSKSSLQKHKNSSDTKTLSGSICSNTSNSKSLSDMKEDSQPTSAPQVNLESDNNSNQNNIKISTPHILHPDTSKPKKFPSDHVNLKTNKMSTKKDSTQSENVNIKRSGNINRIISTSNMLKTEYAIPRNPLKYEFENARPWANTNQKAKKDLAEPTENKKAKLPMKQHKTRYDMEYDFINEIEKLLSKEVKSRPGPTMFSEQSDGNAYLIQDSSRKVLNDRAHAMKTASRNYIYRPYSDVDSLDGLEGWKKKSASFKSKMFQSPFYYREPMWSIEANEELKPNVSKSGKSSKSESEDIGEVLVEKSRNKVSTLNTSKTQLRRADLESNKDAIKVSKLSSKKYINRTESKNENVSEIEECKEKLRRRTADSSIISKTPINEGNALKAKKSKKRKRRDVSTRSLNSDSGENITLKTHKKFESRDASKLNSSVDKEIEVKTSKDASCKINHNTVDWENENSPKMSPQVNSTAPNSCSNSKPKLKSVRNKLSQSGSNKNEHDKKSTTLDTNNNKSALIRKPLIREHLNNESLSDQSDNYYSDDYDYYPSFDSIDYDTDSYYSDSSESIDFDDTYFDSDSDQTYELPEHVAEDIYIANGTAVKSDLPEHENLGFDSDESCAQIVEIPTSSEVQQSNNLSEENNHVSKEIHTTSIEADNDGTINDSDTSCPKLIPITNDTIQCSEFFSDTYSDTSCPELVPITNDTIQYPEFSSDTYSESTSSFTDSSSDCLCNEVEIPVEPTQMKAEIFKAKNTNLQEIPMCLTRIESVPACDNNAKSSIDQIVHLKKNTSNYKVITVHNEIIPELSNGAINKPLQLVSKVSSPPVLLTTSSAMPSISVSSVSMKSLETETERISNRMKEIFSEKHFNAASDCTGDSDMIDVTPKKNPFANEIMSTPSQLQYGTLFFNAVNSNHVIALVKEPLYIYGTVKVTLIAGFVNIFGYHPKMNETLEIFSPQGYSSIKIEPGNRSKTSSLLVKDNVLSLTTNFIKADLEKLIERYVVDKDAIILFQRNDNSKKVNMLRKYMSENLFPNMNNIQTERPFYASEVLLRCIFTTKTDKPLIIEPKWNCIEVGPSKVMVTGGKSVGKSTLVRYLVNRNLNVYQKVLLIDLDVGQPEIFVPQTITATTLTVPLLGPGYYLNQVPDIAFLAGQVNVVLLPHQYIRSVEALINYCNEKDEYRNIPWIINTMGYNKGFGDELIAFICNILRPTNVVQIESNKEINNFDLILSKDNVDSLELNIIGNMLSSRKVCHPEHDLTLLTSAIPSENRYPRDDDLKPRDVRLAMIICRLSQILTNHADWLTDAKPVCASLKDLKIRYMEDDQICTKDMNKTLVGNLVYLCREQSGQTLECKGIGVVRAIDYSLNQIYLLPAVSAEDLINVNCLAVCGIPLPSSILTNQGPKVKGPALYVFDTINHAASMYVKQMYNRPQHFLSGRHKAIIE